MKEVRINFSYGDGTDFKYLISYFKDGNLIDWEEVISTNDIPKRISEFYFPGKQTTP